MAGTENPPHRGILVATAALHTLRVVRFPKVVPPQVRVR